MLTDTVELALECDFDDLALAALLREVARTGYRFTSVTPLTHQRVLARPADRAMTTLRDLFGWNRLLEPSDIAPDLLALMQRAGIVQRCGALVRSALRIAAIDDDLFLHSAFPTIQSDAVFFGPDTYRFARFVRTAQNGTAAPNHPPRILDVGCGSGAGGIVAARHCGHPAPQLVMSDINPLALRLCAINAAQAGVAMMPAQGDALAAVGGDFDLIISNPPYLNDDAQRAYRHGGGDLGRALSLRIAAEAITRLAPGGRLLLYTGVAIVDGIDPLQAELLPLLAAAGCDWSYEEIDPDVFGEELERPVYAHIDRIAAVGLCATRRRQAH
ncbi:methylase of polypeptide subunit release factors [Actimicrobium sp. GrIS 1.19]|uniref:class I SAM-dependent methyltransferase n=1 Tax=Actimicrobium sp. GrIS 1.19 TaxID=3071708 RepID=UPI002E045274|nr:methylase of polypeptide subunit release factors [Actimicrobium sp. GrIS 1.19]